MSGRRFDPRAWVGAALCAAYALAVAVVVVGLVRSWWAALSANFGG